MTRPNHLKLAFTADDEVDPPPEAEEKDTIRALLEAFASTPYAASYEGGVLSAPELADTLTQATAKPQAKMSTPTREEFEARLETVEARMDARVAKIEGKIDSLIAQMSERDRRQEERDKRIEMLAESAAKSAEHASTLKGHFWGAIVTIVLSVGGIAIASYFSTQSSNIMIAQTTLAAFQAGQANPPPPAKKP